MVQKVQRDERSKRIDDALYNKLKKTYNLNNEQPNLDYFVSVLNADYYKRKWKLPSNFEADNILFTIGETNYTYKDFGNHLVKTQRILSERTPFNYIVSEKSAQKHLKLHGFTAKLKSFFK